MPWFNVEDNLCFHPKATAAGNPALGLWVRAGSWSMQNLTDGFIPHDLVRMLGTAGEAKRLVSSGLWVAKGDGFEFHEWESRQRSRVQIEVDREAARERQRRRRRDKNGHYEGDGEVS